MDNIKEETSNQVLLIDLENCPSQINQLMENLGQYAHVVVCYAQSGAKIPIDWIVPLTATVNANKLRIAKMPNTGKNSADFGIAFWAGVLMIELPKQTHFDIVSNDNDLEHVVNLLKDQGRSATRIGIKKESAQSVSAMNGDVTQANYYLQEYCLHLLNHNKSRPAKKETLLNNIRSKFKAENVNPELIFDNLSKQSVIAIKDNKIAYNQDKMAKIAALESKIG